MRETCLRSKSRLLSLLTLGGKGEANARYAARADLAA